MRKIAVFGAVLVLVGCVAMAVTALTDSRPAFDTSGFVAAEPVSDEGVLDWGDCIACTSISYCMPVPIGKCEIKIQAKHWCKSSGCCAHDAGTLQASVNLGGYEDMRLIFIGLENGCGFTIWESRIFEVDNDSYVVWDVYDPNAFDTCFANGGEYVDCE